MPDLAGRVRRRRAGRRPGTRTGTSTRSTTSTAGGGRSATSTTASGPSSARSGCRRAERLARYLRPDELHTAFNFHLLLAPWDAAALREAIDTSIDALAEVGAPPTWVLSNHDVVRHVTRYGGGRARQRGGPGRRRC